MEDIHTVLIIVIIFIIINCYNKLHKCSESFVPDDYNKIYKSDDGYFMTIKKGEKIKGVQYKIILMHNDFNKFKKMANAYNSRDYMLESIDLYKYVLPIDGWDKSMFLQNVPSAAKGSSNTTETWKPLIPNKSTDITSTIQTDTVWTNVILLNYYQKGTLQPHLGKVFRAIFNRI